MSTSAAAHICIDLLGCHFLWNTEGCSHPCRPLPYLLWGHFVWDQTLPAQGFGGLPRGAQRQGDQSLNLELKDTPALLRGLWALSTGTLRHERVGPAHTHSGTGMLWQNRTMGQPVSKLGGVLVTQSDHEDVGNGQSEKQTRKAALLCT